MTIFNYFSQFMATATYILMCHLILSKHISRKINALLYAYLILVCIFLAPVLGQFGIPVFFIGSDIILLFNKRDRVLNLLLFQIIWAWSVLTDYMLTIPLRLILGYDFSAIDNSLPLTLLFSILHALLCILPCLFIGNRLHRKLVTNQDVIPPRIQRLLFLEVTICSCIFLINIIFGSLLHYPTDILLFNGILIFCFATANVLIFLMLYNTLQANKKLELQAREQENLTHYMAQLENHYQDIRRFKHDYLNILSTITGYIQETIWTSFGIILIPVSSRAAAFWSIRTTPLRVCR